MRFSESFAKQNGYSIDRLIASANMFDILPSSAAPATVQLSKELEDAKELARSTFRSLPQSIERSSILNALGRMGQSSLKHKIRYRAQPIVDVIGARLPELTKVIDEAVDCRNHYVHGSAGSFDYNANFGTVCFFIDALEFVFAASDLIEAGWEVETWSQIPTSMSHPFAKFRVTYVERLRELKRLLG
jgi:hypothetical protein